MTFEIKNEAKTAYEHCELSVNGDPNVLSDGGIVIEPIHELPWSRCCATVIDKYGVCWWISI